MITAAQCRAARALLQITQDQLATKSGVSQKAIANFELGKTVPMRANLVVLQQTLELLGVEFLEGGGLRLKDS
jgi:transcriptional regulator with XRE-family HTH domain